MDQDYIQRWPYSYEEAPDTDLYSFVSTHFKKNEKKIALVDNATGQSYTYGQLEQAIESAAYNMQQIGIRKEQRLVLYSCVSIEYTVLLLASWRLGVVTCTINTALPTSTVTYMLELIKPNILFTDKDLLSSLKKPNLTDSMRVILRDSDGGDLCYKGLLKPRPVDCEIDPVDIDTHEDVAFFILTSGTSGLPKAVEMTHRNFVTAKFATLAPQIVCTSEINVVFQPPAHIMGLWLLCIGLYLGSKGVVISKFDFDTFLDVLSKYKIEKTVVVPTIGMLLAMHPSVDKYDLSHLKFIFTGAAPLSVKIQDAITNRIGCEVVQGYGMTEAGAPIFTPMKSFMDNIPPGTIGLPLHGFEVKVVDMKTGQDLPANQKGELFLRSATVMKGYLDNPRATAEVIDDDKWYHTGDYGYYDNKGFFFILDRVKELIHYQNYQIAPADLESVLLSHSEIADAAVIGVPDTVSGQVPLAFIVKKPSVTITEDDITKYVEGRVPDHKRIRGGVKFISSIPKSPAGKIYKRMLREQLLM